MSSRIQVVSSVVVAVVEDERVAGVGCAMWAEVEEDVAEAAVVMVPARAGVVVVPIGAGVVVRRVAGCSGIGQLPDPLASYCRSLGLPLVLASRGASVGVTGKETCLPMFFPWCLNREHGSMRWPVLLRLRS